MKKSKDAKKEALDIFRILKRHFDDGVSIPELAKQTGKSERTLYRHIQVFREQGVGGLTRAGRADKGRRRKISAEVEKAIEGLCLQSPKPPISWVYRQISQACDKKGLPSPSYSVVLDIYHRLSQRLKTLAHNGDRAYEEHFDELLRRESEMANEMWQCDHKDLKLWARDRSGRIGKVWITAIIDDYSRMIMGYFLAIGTPNSMRIAITLRQAIWSKTDEVWPVSGIPDIFYSDHGADFESSHIEQVAADLRMELVNTIAYKPRGRGKIERFFRTIVQMFCPDHKTSKDKPKPLDEIESAFKGWVVEYHRRRHSEIKTTPLDKWSQSGIVPRLPESLDALDLMLMKVSPRTMRRDGIRFDNNRYSDELLTQSIGERFDIRYDPRDLSHIWVYGEGGALICKAKQMGVHPSKEETQNTIARRQRVKKNLKRELHDKRKFSEGFLAKPGSGEVLQNPTGNSQQVQRRLRKHFHERP